MRKVGPDWRFMFLLCAGLQVISSYGSISMQNKTNKKNIKKLEWNEITHIETENKCQTQAAAAQILCHLYKLACLWPLDRATPRAGRSLLAD